MSRHGGSKSGRRRGRRPQASKRRITELQPGSSQRVVLRSSGLSQRPKLLPMVPTTGTCPTGKNRYATSQQAEKALENAQENRRRQGQALHVEERWYPKPGDKPCVCGGYHLTSKPPQRPKPGVRS